MESPEKANMRLAQEYNTAEKHIHQRVNSIHLLAEMFGCDTETVEIMLSLLRTHGVYEIVEAVNDTTDWTFGTIVIAAKDATLARLKVLVDDDLHRELSAVRVSIKPEIFGTALQYSDRLGEKAAMAFSFMIKYGVNVERITELNRAYSNMEV